MKNSDLIQKLQELPAGMEVCLIDLSNDQDGEGITPKFTVDVLENESEEGSEVKFIGIQYTSVVEVG